MTSPSPSPSQARAQAAAKPKGGSGTKKGPRPKHVPQRMCVVCRDHAAKRALTRLVRVGDGQVEVDPSGRKNGRGAYLCARPECWERALKGELLAKALNTTLPTAVRDHLRDHAATLATPEGAAAEAAAAKENA